MLFLQPLKLEPLVGGILIVGALGMWPSEVIFHIFWRFWWR